MSADKALEALGFKVLGNIGQGSFGQVKMAVSKSLDKKVAVKIIDCRKKKQEYVSKYLPREIAILREVKHPHIVKMLEMLSRGGFLFIIMEAAVTDLHQKVKDHGPISCDKAKIWFAQLLSAVAYLHQKNIVHRDLKSHNVLLSEDEQVKLTDFTFGRFVKCQPELSETYCCTPQFAAPEVLLEKPYDPKKSDVWSLGVILFAMVTGSMPFKDSNVRSLPNLQREPVKFPDEIAVEESCQSIISFMLQYDPSIRPSVPEVEQHHWLQSKQAGRELLILLSSQMLLLVLVLSRDVRLGHPAPCCRTPLRALVITYMGCISLYPIHADWSV
ncbi:testis-specific serine/threonine-protein kinase 6-like [Salminus brasiliensis]|uniref:testis-specific serine/threonine-protein kinase 6-like n=1 Tax=Salminus brasiliensis TaxID=930266 RepID=UPI003B8371CE